MPKTKATKQEVDVFLKTFKKSWPPSYYVVERDENEEGLLILEITPEHRKSEILALTYKNYDKGPEADKSGSSGEVWFFSKMVRGTKVYIKLKIWEGKNKKSYAKCMSFHPAKY